jgi:hypothetical protein
MVLRKLDIHMHQNETELLPCIVCTKINSIWIKDLNVSSETITLEENTWGKLLNISLGNHFLDITPKPQATQRQK